MIKSAVNYWKAMNLDMAKSRMGDGLYGRAINIDILADDRNSQTAVINIKGNALRFEPLDLAISRNLGNTDVFLDTGSLVDPLFTITNPEVDTRTWPLFIRNHYIIGNVQLRNEILFFVTHDYNYNPADEITTQSLSSIWSFDIETEVTKLLWLGDLGFSTFWPIEALSYRENESIGKIYFTDYFHDLRFFNAYDPLLYNIAPKEFDIVPHVDSGEIIVSAATVGGNFTGGSVVAYAFNYVNSKGAQSKVRYITEPVPIATLDRGADVNEQVSRALEVTVNDIDSSFDLIRIYRIRYTTLNTSPEVRLIEEFNINSASPSLTFIDDGSNFVSTFTLEEILLLGAEPFSPRTIAYKDEILFASNIKQRPFLIENYDCRAYSWNLSNEAKIVTRDGIATILTSPNDVVPETHDCINPSVKAETNRNNETVIPLEPDYDTYLYRYNAGSSFGATGKNIELEWGVSERIIHSGTSEFEHSESAIEQTAPEQQVQFENTHRNPVDFTLRLNFKRDEVYRIFIQFGNDREQVSFANWVTDIRTPDVEKIPFAVTSGGTTKARDLQLVVRILTNLPQGATKFRVTAVKRDLANSTCLYQGIMSPLYLSFGNISLPILTGSVMEGVVPTDPNFFNPWRNTINNNANWQQNTVCFVSPDIDEQYFITGFFKVHSGAKEAINVTPTNLYNSNTITRRYEATNENVLIGNTASALARVNTASAGQRQNCDVIRRVSAPRAENGAIRMNLSDPIVLVQRDDLQLVTIANTVQFWTQKRVYSNTPVGEDNFTDTLPHPAIVAYLQNGFITQLFDTPTNVALNNGPFNLNPNEPHLVVADYKILRPQQYGGNTYEDRSRNITFPISEWSRGTETIAYGDTYISYVKIQTGSMPPTAANASNDMNQVREVIVIPLECRVPWDLRFNDRARIDNQASNQLISNEDFSSFNAVYAQRNQQITAPAKPLNFIPIYLEDNATQFSALKIPNQTADGWTTWPTSNKKYAHNEAGPIVKLIENGHEIFFLQHQGCGYLQINPQALLNANTNEQVILGTGSTLERYIYLSTNAGSQQQWAILKTPYGVLFYDQNSKKIRLMTQGNKDISDPGGIHSDLIKLPRLGDNPLREDGVAVGYDEVQRRAYFSFNTSEVLPDNNYTFVWNFLQNGFTTTIDRKFPMFPKAYQKTYMLNPTLGDVWEVNAGPRGSFFGIVSNFSITFYVAEPAMVVKVLNNLEFFSEAYNTDGSHNHDVSITSFELFSEHSRTGIQPFDAYAKRYLRKWRLQSPFAVFNEDLSLSNNPRQRIRGEWIGVTLIGNNLSNIELVIHPVVSHLKLQAPY